MKKILAAVAVIGAVTLGLTGCATSGSGGGSGNKVITVGFAQTGSESGWRAANTQSMKTAFSAKNGFKLIFNAADNKPENQIAVSRQVYNDTVLTYHNAIQTFPAVVVAGMFGFRRREFFEIGDPGDREVPAVSFSQPSA